MKAFAGTFPTSAGVFMTTQWSVVADLPSDEGELSPERTERALAQLCQDYWPPLYRFVRQRGYSQADAQDLTQGFFAYLLEKKTYLHSDPSKGRFRTFLLFVLKRYLAKTHAHERRQKRGGNEVFLDASRLETLEKVNSVFLTDAPLDEERAFECDWAAALAERAIETLNADYSTGQKARVLAELKPFLTGGVGLPTHESAAARLGVPPETLRSHLYRLRACYRAALRAQVARTVAREEDVEGELRYLCRVLIARV